MMLIIDRFEGQWVVLTWEDQVFQVPKAFLPAGAKEGDCLSMTLAFDLEAQKERQERMNRLMNDLFE